MRQAPGLSDEPAAAADRVTAHLHGTAVAAAGRALLILGPAGAGKSSLALEMMALGAGLIADDVVKVMRRDGALWACQPDGGAAEEGAAHRGVIEARGLGLIRVGAAAPAEIALVIDVASPEAERIPPRRVWRCCGGAAPLLRRPPHLSAAPLLVALRAGGLIDPSTPLAPAPPPAQSSARCDSASPRDSGFGRGETQDRGRE